jgi:hypothetical protein
MTALNADKNPARADTPSSGEAYGQDGVLAATAALLARLSLVAALFAIFLWYWSFRVGYLVEINRPDSKVRISNVVGRLVFRFIPEPTTALRPSMNPPIEIAVPQFTASNPDPWQPGLWKTIGIEQIAETQPSGTVGSVLRIQWRLIVICLLIPPTWLVISNWRKRWRAADEEDDEWDEQPAR